MGIRLWLGEAEEAFVKEVDRWQGSKRRWRWLAKQRFRLNRWRLHRSRRFPEAIYRKRFKIRPRTDGVVYFKKEVRRAEQRHSKRSQHNG